ncbi:MAG: hypothetical protein H6741_18740 [Alphaproteobacteria bacterium]|nr:hypothetical protein [Alphaproteobacteria bacterium]
MSRRPVVPSRRDALRTALLGLVGLGISGRAQAQEAETPAPAPSDPTELLLMLHPGVAAELVERSTVASLYQGRSQRWARGIPAVPFLRPMDSPMTEAFLAQVLGRTRSAYESAWQSIELSGQGLRPVELASLSDCVERIRVTEGGVTYVLRGELVEGAPEGVTLLPAPRKDER